MLGMPITISSLAQLAGLALLLITGSLPAAASEPVRVTLPIRMATLNVNVVVNELCKDDIKKLREEATERYRLLPGGTGDYSGPVETRAALHHEFSARSAAIYAKAYGELQRTVADYCKSEGIDLVLNDDRPAAEVDPDDADTVARDTAKRVVLTKVDITPQILKRITTKATPPVKSR